MSIPLRHMMEYLQIAYVRAVVARAEATYQTYEQDYGIDGRISAIRGLTPEGKPIPDICAFDCQLKATRNWKIENDHVKFDLDVRAYNTLIALQDRLGILILYRLPKNIDKWLTVSEESLCMRKCCYWKLLSGEPTTNTSTKQVCIPQSQLFDTSAVTYLLDQVRQRNEDIRRWRMSQ